MRPFTDNIMSHYVHPSTGKIVCINSREEKVGELVRKDLYTKPIVSTVSVDPSPVQVSKPVPIAAAPVNVNSGQLPTGVALPKPKAR